MAFVGCDESAVRAFPRTDDPTLHMPAEEAVRAHGLEVLNQLLCGIATGGTS